MRCLSGAQLERYLLRACSAAENALNISLSGQVHGGVAFEHAVGEQHQPVPRAQVQPLHPALVRDNAETGGRSPARPAPPHRHAAAARSPAMPGRDPAVLFGLSAPCPSGACADEVRRTSCSSMTSTRRNDTSKASNRFARSRDDLDRLHGRCTFGRRQHITGPPPTSASSTCSFILPGARTSPTQLDGGQEGLARSWPPGCAVALARSPSPIAPASRSPTCRASPHTSSSVWNGRI
ncbi:hypothetical protein C8D88_102779 [Lentzea atacamensis]|uniref:Uncharacterized protein n=1 Tax=Lentzea atacamensis TaxID=531938 RepID=A0A316IQU4_9PSEU|nr:hypothetical protein C8D88_102779 [Lentzea atacamensis]